MLTKMIFATLLLFALSALNGYASEKKREANCTVVIAADLHFDMPPETDQFHHVLAINALGDHRRIDGVILAGDLFDKSAPKILAPPRQRWERGPGYRQIHYDTYPTFGNHDISPETGRPEQNRIGMELNLHYLDSTLLDMKQAGRILNIHRSSRSYSIDIGGVNFARGPPAAGAPPYCTPHKQ